MDSQILLGDCRSVLASLPPESVHCMITSPPYWSLRDYGLEPSIWGGSRRCQHSFSVSAPPSRKRGGSDPGKSRKQISNQGSYYDSKETAFCSKCGAWRGCLGLEPNPQMYVDHMVQIFRMVRRVLRHDGIAWLNLGDSYTSGNRKGHGTREGYKQETNTGCLSTKDYRPPTPDGLKPKDLCGIPWRVALALQSDGWWLRSDIIWQKPGPMPSSVKDRCTTAHEYLFMLTKSERYFFDSVAIEEEGKTTPKRNKRSVWTVPTQGYKKAHFATFPERLVIPPILSSTSEQGCCSICGAPMVRVTEKERVATRPGKDTKITGTDPTEHGNRDPGRHISLSRTIGWKPSCKHSFDPVPCTVMDIFAGSGTVGKVCRHLNRNFIGIELNPAYIEMIYERMKEPMKDHPELRNRKSDE